MPITISKEARQKAISSIQRYFDENMDEPIGNLTADALLSFFLQELGPSIYNQAVRDVQEHLQTRVLEADIHIHEDEFDYWRNQDKGSKKKSL